MTDVEDLKSIGELLAHARAMEDEAHERYSELADQMEVHNNPEVAALFRKMAEVEQIHVRKILARAEGMELPHIPPWEYRWQGEEAPQTVSVTDAHYMMQPYHALKLALRAEKRGLAFYTGVVETHSEASILDLARELQEEEREHVAEIEAWLKKVPKPEEDWDEDPDPPAHQE